MRKLTKWEWLIVALWFIQGLVTRDLYLAIPMALILSAYIVIHEIAFSEIDLRISVLNKRKYSYEGNVKEIIREEEKNFDSKWYNGPIIALYRLSILGYFLYSCYLIYGIAV